MDSQKTQDSKPVFASKDYPAAVNPQLAIDPISGERSVERRKLALLRKILNRIIKNGLSPELLQRELVKLRRELGQHYDRAYLAALKYYRLK